MSRSNITRSSTHAILVASAIVLLSGCAEGSLNPASQPPTEISQIFGNAASLKPDAQHYHDDSWIYTAQFYGDDLSVYKRNGLTLTWQKTLTGPYLSAPAGTVTTVNGWWYVANGGDSNVLIYQTKHSGPSGPVGHLDDYGQNPVNVDVTPSRQLVAVSNYGSSSQAGSVSVYTNGATEPTRMLTYGSDPLQGAGIAIDHQGDCFWSFNDPNTGSGSIVEFTGCSGSGSVVVSGIPKAGGIVFDQRDDLFYVDEVTVASRPNGVYECDKKFVCGQSPFASGFGLPTNINFDYKDKDLWVADASGYIGVVDLQKGTVTKIPAHGGPSDPPIGIAPERGGS